MRGILSVVLILAYIFIGWGFHFRAMTGRIDPERPAWGTDVLRPDLFTGDGQRLRRAALRFYVLGGILLIVGLWAVAA